jgi:type IV pilus assembly protein PilA
LKGKGIKKMKNTIGKMLKNKERSLKLTSLGFTLIEILAVLIILAAVALLVTPLILKQVKDSKDNLYDVQIENIKKSASIYVTDNIKDLKESSYTFYLGNLQKLGLAEKNIINPKTNEKLNECLKIVVTKIGENIFTTVNENDVTENCQLDGDIMMILVGATNYQTKKNESYVEPGVILKKINGGNLDSKDIKVKVTMTYDGMNEINNVITSIRNYNDLGKIPTDNYYRYEIVYTYEGLEEKRNITVSDMIVPECMILTSDSLVENGWRTGNQSAFIMPTSSLNFDDYLYSLDIKDKATYGNDMMYEFSKTGEYTLHGYIRDKSGNVGKCEATVKYQTSSPTCEIMLEGTKGSNDWYTSALNVTLTGNMKESNLKYYGLSLDSDATYNQLNSQNFDKNGTYTIYGYLKDEAGFTASCSKTVKVDTNTSFTGDIEAKITGTNIYYTAPIASSITLSIYPLPSQTASGYIYQWYDGDELIEGATDANYITIIPGTYNYKTKITNGAGVSYETPSKEIVILENIPTCSLKASGTKGSNNWYKSDVSISFNSKEDVRSYGIYNTTAVDNNNLNGSETYTINSDTSGTNIYGIVKNFTEVSTCILNVKRDTIAPKVSLSASGSSSTVTLTASASDSGSGIAKYEFYNGSSWVNNGTSRTYSFTASSGSKTYRVRVTDKAGNVSSNASLTESCSRTSGSGSCGSNDYYSCTTGRSWSVYNGSCPSYSGGGSSYSGGGSSYTNTTSTLTITERSDGRGINVEMRSNDGQCGASGGCGFVGGSVSNNYFGLGPGTYTVTNNGGAMNVVGKIS